MKFGSTWLKTALLGGAMLVMSGVFAQGTPAEGKKLTETFDEGITAAYTPAIENKEKVAAGEYTVTFTVATGKELGDVTFNGEKLSPASAEKPLEFKFTMPSDKDGVLVAKVKASTPAEGKKLTETFDEGITATYSPEIADKTKVAAGEYTVTFTVVKGKELGDVTFNGEKLTATAEKPLEFKFTMPSDKDGVLVAKVKGEAPAPTPKVKITWANDPKEGVKEMHFNKAKIEDNKLKGWEKEEVAVAAADVYYVINFVVDVDNYKYVSFAINEKNAAGTSKMTEYQLDKDIFELVNKEKKYLCHYATIAWSADEDVVECELIAKTKSKKKPSAVEDNAFAAVNVYPNPFAGKLVVNEVAEASRVTLVNAQGVVLRSVAVNGANQVELDVTDVPAGIYMVVVENGAARRAFKVVK
ncbi:MAG: T9SS type A sorting domain-containing protein [Bacteroides sp.]